MPRSTSPRTALERYQRKRDFARTPEPAGGKKKRTSRSKKSLSFVVQKHWASRLHYDFRLELDGVLLSWAVPKGPSYDPREKRVAIHVEDHPVSYADFEGTIPPRQYGAGTVIVWDRGTWEPVGDAREGMLAGKLVFRLHGEKLAGLWELVRIARPHDRQEPWMLFKKRDEWARPLAEYDVITALPDSVVDHPLGLLEKREAPDAPDRRTRSPASRQAPKAVLAVARPAELPARLQPQLATLASAPPSGGDWIIETKFDGYRLLARIDAGKASLFTRGGHDWTTKMPALASDLEHLGIGSAWLDGEIVVLNEAGLPDFNRLQNAIDTRRNAEIDYFVFDLPYLDGLDLRDVPLASRRRVLEALLEAGPHERVRLSRAFEASPAQMLAAACRMKLEGIMLKRADAPYVSARTDTWLKLKCSLQQEFVIVGFTDRSGSTAEIGSLLLGYHENGKLRFAGSVGTGWNAKTGHELHARLAKIETDRPAVDPDAVRPGRWSRRPAGSQRWVKPRLVAEVSFSDWTPEGHIRHALFRGIRTDKPAKAVTRESATAVQSQSPDERRMPAQGVRVTNPGRVVDPSSGVTKLGLVRYYESVAEWILPHLRDRPTSLVRAPEGIAGELFFQKHPETRMPGLTELDASLWPGHSALLAVDSAEALVAAAQMNVIEFHTWNSTRHDIDRPDRAVFDLDPGEGVGWPQVREAALLMRAMLSELQLESWLKTSGGKGLHVVVPLVPEFDYAVVKGFTQSVVRHMARTIPQRFVARAGGANRTGRIFIDYLRNGHGQTTAAAFSARARPGLGVSMPVDWDDLPALKSAAQWSVSTAREYLSFRTDDPWAGYWRARQALAPAMERLAT